MSGTLPPTEEKGRLPKSRGEALCILELWAERKDVQNMGWGWPEWRGMNPSFADELLACVKLLREQPHEPAAVHACEYEHDHDNPSLYLTGCGHEFYLDSGMELYDFCPHCGGAVETTSPTKDTKHG